MDAKMIRVLEARRQREALIRDRERILQRVKAVQNSATASAGGEMRYRAMFELSMMPTLVLDSESFYIRDANRAFCELCGCDSAALRHRDLRELLDEPSRARFEQILEMLAQTGRGTLSDMSLQIARGRNATIDLSITFIGEAEDRFVHVACKDVSEQKALQQELAEMAARDELTGLYNQRALRVRLEAGVQNARTYNRPLSLVSIDLDNFKQCNDQHGHPVGDKVLCVAGQVILEQVRSGDIGFRNGGDEFCVLLDSASVDIAQRVGDRIRQAFAKDECYGTSMSIGVAELQPSMDAVGLLKAADEALYRAKSKGKDTICVA
jgi:diguanylate cyclase (GGDEF)-like protein/PAS domain S-box-containing protein